MLEKTFQNKVIKYLKEIGAYVINVEGLKSGYPDIFACFDGKFIGIELKGDSGYKVKPNQLLQLKKIRESGGISFVLTYSKHWIMELNQFITNVKRYDIEEIDWENL